MTICERDDEPETAYTHFDITGEEHAERVAEMVHRFASSVGLQLPDGLPHTYTELENWKRRVPPYKRGSNGFMWETENGKVCYLMALVEPASRQDLLVVTYLCYPHPEWHFKVSGRLATFCGQAAYDALMADMAAHANVDRIGEMARFFTAHGF